MRLSDTFMRSARGLLVMLKFLKLCYFVQIFSKNIFRTIETRLPIIKMPRFFSRKAAPYSAAYAILRGDPGLEKQNFERFFSPKILPNICRIRGYFRFSKIRTIRLETEHTSNKYLKKIVQKVFTILLYRFFL